MKVSFFQLCSKSSLDVSSARLQPKHPEANLVRPGALGHLDWTGAPLGA